METNWKVIVQKASHGDIKNILNKIRKFNQSKCVEREAEITKPT